MASDSVLTRLEALVQQRLDGEDRDPSLLPRFVSAYFQHIREEQLGNRSAVELLAAAELHHDLAQQREPGQPAVAVAPLSSSQHGCDMAVMTVAPDMAFIVDTVLMAIRATTAEIDWIMHPVVRLGRDDQGRLTRVEGGAGQADHGDEESLVYVEFSAPIGFDGEELVRGIRRRLADLFVVVADYQPMRDRLRDVARELHGRRDAVDGDQCAEVEAFLHWLDNHHFTLLGYRQRRVAEGSESGDEAMVDVPGTSLGLLREDRLGIDPDGYVAPAAELDRYAQSSRILVVAKGNTRSWIHHPDPLDVVAVKQIDDNGNITGAYRFLGLFSAEAYAASPQAIPVLGHKVRRVLDRAAFRPGSHDAKSLAYILETFPRDELFQSSETELFDTALNVLAMRESEPLRLFMRRDRYGRFYSCLVYISRDQYAPGMRRVMARELERQLDGTLDESDATFLRGGVVRLHYQIAIDPSTESVDTQTTEQALRAATRSWPDAFAAAAAGEGRGIAGYRHAFPAGYTERTDAAAAVADARVLASLAADDAPVLALAVTADSSTELSLKLFGVGTETPLSQVLPVLENFGLAVRTQRPFGVHAPDGTRQWIHEFEADHEQAHMLDDPERAAHLADAFAQVSSGRAENDRLNRLIISAGLAPREVVFVRTVTRYLMQTDVPFSARYLEDMLASHPHILADMVTLFARRFDPDGDTDEQQRLTLIQAIEAAFDDIRSRDADRALRTFFGVVLAMLRSNYYQVAADGQPKPYVSIKLDPARVPELPKPVPAFETFVYSPDVEGVHLRGGLVARGGLRWSDRREDFRTEVLGLLKAQMVKNAVIVPVGAKGGFVVKNAAPGDDRETRQAKGVAGYQEFIRGLLDITDNRTPEGIVHPQRVVCRDGDDPYLVVAADKGTATFSDIANALSREYGYWLDDAFASGGSAGYDHKAMGITARGAWESVKRHFREMEHDTQSEPFTVIGIGDMAGDVFGNGMLQSEHIRLLAAFNHMHIFIDPNPDAAASHAERKRLFAMGRSAWTDYDDSVISAGGGIYERSAKLIELSDEAMQALAIRARRLTPDELIHELLQAPVDLLWNGGIGTYVKARGESHTDVGDRANDSVRVDGRDLRCKVVGEGGNLGMTQAGRIEYALAGGRLNTDAIDNSGGVNSSDIEVNTKIALGAVEVAGDLTRDDRNTLLTAMTESVVSLVLHTNYLQPQQISLLELDAVERFGEHVNFMRTLERAGQIDRAVDGLPDEETIVERRRNRQGLTRPELAVLLSHAKIALADAMLESDLPDDPYLENVLFHGFPEAMRDEYADAIRQHRLKRELVTAVVTNQMVNRLGIAIAHRLAADYSVELADTVRAYILADAWLGAERLYGIVEALDNKISTNVQYDLLKRVSALVKHAVSWQLASALDVPAITELVQRYQAPTQHLLAHMSEYMSGAYARQWRVRRDDALAAGLDDALSGSMASAAVGGGLLDIVALAESRDMDVAQVAQIYFALGDTLSLAWLHRAIQSLHVDGRWPALARSSLRGDCYRIHERLTALVLDAGGDLDAWCETNAGDIAGVRARMEELQTFETPTFAHLTVAVRGLSKLHDSRERLAAAHAAA